MKKKKIDVRRSVERASPNYELFTSKKKERTKIKNPHASHLRQNSQKKSSNPTPKFASNDNFAEQSSIYLSNMTKSQHFQAVQAAATGVTPGTPASKSRASRRPTIPKQKPSHAINNVRPIRNHTPASRRQATPAHPVTKPRASACPNTSCDSPNVEDGVCHSCGTIITESNIVSEITFGENAAGGAVLQGTFIGDGKGHANTMGPNFNRLGGGGDDSGGHVDAIREGMLQLFMFLLLHTKHQLQALK